MKIKTLVVGELEENCYIVENDDSCIIIDPGDEAQKIIDNVDKEVKGILVTHYHFDHIGALNQLKEKYNLQENNFNIDGFKFEVIETPGHTSDSKTFYFRDDKVMFVGDFIFESSIGRMDLPSGSTDQMKKSLSNILSYPPNIVLYPGHGKPTTLSKEQENLKYYIDLL